MLVEGSILSRLCDHFFYPLDNEPTVIFGLRGCLPADLLDGDLKGFSEFKESHRVRQVAVNYLTARCTIGLWDRTANKVAMFPGSTLPSLHYLSKHPSCASTFNILCPGYYRMRKGIHPRNSNGFEPHTGFLMDGYGIAGRITKGITRRRHIKDNVKYGLMLPGDNLHAARTEPENIVTNNHTLLKLKYSSSGCITILGQPSKYIKRQHENNDWNFWEKFIDSINNFNSSQEDHPFILFNFSDLQSSRIEGLRHVVRYGSASNQVGRLQTFMKSVIDSRVGQCYYSGPVNNIFTETTAASFMRFQEDYTGGNAESEIDVQSFLSKIKHFTPYLTQPENAIYRSSTNHQRHYRLS